jgi:hypothetical protein
LIFKKTGRREKPPYEGIDVYAIDWAALRADRFQQLMTMSMTIWMGHQATNETALNA